VRRREGVQVKSSGTELGLGLDKCPLFLGGTSLSGPHYVLYLTSVKAQGTRQAQIQTTATVLQQSKGPVLFGKGEANQIPRQSPSPARSLPTWQASVAVEWTSPRSMAGGCSAEVGHPCSCDLSWKGFHVWRLVGRTGQFSGLGT
jgi:hypothetical protein